jgi:hypothetical protein
VRNPKATPVCLALALSGAFGCSREAPRLVDAAQPAPAVAAPQPPPAPPPRTAEPFHQALPERCEVEILGNVHLPKGYKGPPPIAFVAIGDCLAPSPNIVGAIAATPQVFFVEVMVPQNTELTVCAASEPKPGEPSKLYGKDPRVFHAAGFGEVEFRDVVVELKPGAPKAFPRPKPKK